MSGVAEIHRGSLRARIIYAVFAAVMPRLVRWISRRGGPEAMPGMLAQLGRRTNTVARLQRLRPYFRIRFTRESAAGVPVEIVRRADCVAPLGDGVILYFHGGGFFTGGLDTHLHVVAALARRTRLPVVHVDYRQFPDVSVDGSVEDCVGAYRWLLEQGADPAKTVIAGDSAGGFLTFTTALRAQQEGLPAPAGVIGISALLELDGTARSTHPNMGTDAFGIADTLPDLVEHVCPSPPMRRELSPINGRLETMPPALLIAAESEILRCDNERLHAALLAQGRSSRLELWTHQVHAFPALFPFLPDSRAAFDLMVRFVAERLADPGASGETRREVS
ncbi:alpha/beta hydrolase [Mycolicibacter icosiumassiliensis]|uniref:alpha/beta hydrolase n=1 Tax=Mycolicibacter icosiumassiliensis TaxID=1792835 RepID=UPI0008365C25|nr:alpha/beta hydrolase [Mycolicibacter icosiumassiliensis]